MSSRNKDLRLSVEYVSLIRGYITTRKPQNSEFMKKKGMRVEVEYTGRIEINGVSLTLGGDQRGNKSR
jgi:hypothetical protein